MEEGKNVDCEAAAAANIKYSARGVPGDTIGFKQEMEKGLNGPHRHVWPILPFLHFLFKSYSLMHPVHTGRPTEQESERANQLH